ncbi:MAG: PorP/SprF family type IX secretion system membrane protein [Saprospiraceae bacterium]|jgi:type IX secretion system PorP/SprF family membrane protein
MKIRFYLFMMLLGALGPVSGQDLHFSMFNMSPLTLNPAFTGAFEGTARIGGIYRDQWASFLQNQFTTPSFYLDVPLMRGLRKQDWVGVGAVMFNDKAGTAEMKYVGSLLSASYHMGLGKDGRSLLTFGLQGGSSQRSIDLMADGLKFADELDKQVGGGGLGIGNGLDRGVRNEVSFLDFSFGAMLRTRLNDNDFLEAGMSLNHLTRPRYGFAGNQGTQGQQEKGARRPMRTALHGRLLHRFSDLFYLEPTMLFQTTGGAAEFAVQAIAGYKINDDFTLRAGPGMRFGDAAQIMIGGDYQDIRVGLSYDLNISSLSKISNFRGGFELAAQYIIKIYKKPKISPAILCPQL